MKKAKDADAVALLMLDWQYVSSCQLHDVLVESCKRPNCYETIPVAPAGTQLFKSNRINNNEVVVDTFEEPTDEKGNKKQALKLILYEQFQIKSNHIDLIFFIFAVRQIF
uniref:Uncharacterized protein n=1 Tax=Glossina pallidipes TaxID=7398 RepID=A0A1A9Z1U5_GLOPL